MEDVEEKRRPPADWREYIKEMKESVRVYAWVWRELISARSKRWAKRATIGLVALTLIGTLMPWFFKGTVDAIPGHDLRKVLWVLAGVVLCKLLPELCHWFHAHWREYVLGDNQGEIDRRTAELYFEKSLGQHLRDSGSLNAANIDKGTNRSLEVEQMMLFDGVPVVFELLIPWLFLIVTMPLIGLAMTVLFINYFIWLLYLNRQTVEACTPLDAEFRKIKRYRLERLENPERVKTNGKEKEEVRHMSAWFERTLIPDRKFWLWFIRMITVRGFTNRIFTVCTLLFGVWRVWEGDWTVGLLLPLVQWTTQISENLWRIGQIEHRLNWNMPSIRAMMDALMQPAEVTDAPGAIDVPDGPLRIELRGISHSYPKTADELKVSPTKVPPVLQGVNLDIGHGEKVALLGPSGAGKTTIMRLLQRYADPREGSILVNGIDLRQLRLSSWLGKVGYIPQQSQIFDGTLRYNLLYGLPDEARASVPNEDIWKLMRDLCVDFKGRLTEGLETVVGRRGIRLSGGEGQRVMIAAAAAKKPRFLLIDEATSSLDSSTEKDVQRGMAELLNDPSVSALIIAHRLSTVEKICSKFVMLRPAEALGAGESQIEAVAPSFGQLYEISPTFRRLADDQGLRIRPRLESVAP